MTGPSHDATPEIVAASTRGVRPRHRQGTAMQTLSIHAPRISGGSFPRTTGQAATA